MRNRRRNRHGDLTGKSSVMASRTATSPNSLFPAAFRRFVSRRCISQPLRNRIARSPRHYGAACELLPQSVGNTEPADSRQRDYEVNVRPVALHRQHKRRRDRPCGRRAK